jgi:hypothetical protein
LNSTADEIPPKLLTEEETDLLLEVEETETETEVSNEIQPSRSEPKEDRDNESVVDLVGNTARSLVDHFAEAAEED